MGRQQGVFKKEDPRRFDVEFGVLRKPRGTRLRQGQLKKLCLTNTCLLNIPCPKSKCCTPNP